MHKILLTGIVLVLSLAQACYAGSIGATEGPAGNAHVPDEYRALYGELEAELKSLQKNLDAHADPGKTPVKFGLELLVANSNRGEVLLTDRVFRATTLTLDRLQDLGVSSVSVSIQFPMLTRSFPRFSEYKEFYRRVAREIRRRDLVLIVEIGTFFREQEFTKLRVDYGDLTLDAFALQLREMTEIIIEEIRPDYLTVLTEPDTMQRNAGLEFTVEGFSAAVHRVVNGLDPGGARLGAGAGTWSRMEYFEALAEIAELNYIDLHIYPIQRDYVWDQVTRIAHLAKKHGKRISIGEAWLYKVSVQELGRIGHVKAFTRDVFSFWQPLDSSFLRVIAGLCRHVNAEFCSFFWMKHLYAYLDYDPQTRKLRPQQLIDRMDTVAGQHILGNRLSGTGETFKSITTAY